MRSMAWAVLAASVLVGGTARAEDVWRVLSVRGEGAIGQMLPRYQQGTLDEELGMAGGLRVGVRPFHPLVIVAAYEAWYLPSSHGAGYQNMLGGGLRLEPRMGEAGWLWCDGNAGVALTGGLTRLALSFGIGFEVSIGDVVGLGPMVRYGHTFATEEDWPSDAMFVSGG